VVPLGTKVSGAKNHNLQSLAWKSLKPF